MAGEPVFIATTDHNTAPAAPPPGNGAQQVAFVPGSWYRLTQWLLAFHEQAHATPGRSRVLGEIPWAGLTPEQAREWSRYEALLTLALASTRLLSRTPLR